MNHVFGEPWIVRHTTYFSDPEAGAEALLNDATEWLQYARCAVHVLTELTHERGSPDARRLTIMLEGIAAFIEMGARCAAQGHLRMQWERVQEDIKRTVAAP